MFLSRFALGLAAVAASGVLTEAPASAASPQDDCISAYEKAQVLRQDGKLRASRAALLVCARAACPRIAQNDCTTWLAEVDARQPTILVTAHDPNGKDSDDVRVFIDDVLVIEKLDGRPISVDPGRHALRYEMGREKREDQLLIVEGEKDRRLLADFAPPSVPAPQVATSSTSTILPDLATTPTDTRAPQSRVPITTWILGGVAIGGIGTFTGFALAGKSVEGCVPGCTQSQVDDFRRDYLIADVALGAAIVSAGVALLIALTASPGRRGVTAFQAPSARVMAQRGWQVPLLQLP